MRKFTFILTLMLFSLQMFSQVQVTGKITDGENGGPLPAASVSIEGTTIGTTTDIEGNYVIMANDPSDVIVFSFIGYETQRMVVGENRTINITLNIDATQLDEVVVTALGLSREKKSLGYSVVEVGGEEDSCLIGSVKILGIT